MAHLSQTEIEAVVMGIAPAGESTRRHLFECPACAARLAREARLEEALHESALAPSASVARAAPARGWRAAWSAAAAVAVVGLGVWIGESLRRDRPSVVPSSHVTAVTPSELPVPGLLDPLSFAPGYTIVPPSEYCRQLDASPRHGPPW